MFIRSERLFLRPIWPEDWADLHAGLNDGEIVRNLSRVPWPYTPDKAREFSAMQHDPRLPHFLITCPRGNQGVDVIGGIGLAEVDGQATLGYWITRDHWGQGYATEAGRAVLTLARTLGHRRVMARHFLDNPASGRVLRKLGFAPTGVGEEFSLGRGVSAPSVTYKLDLGVPSDCDDDLNGGGMGGDGAGRGSFPSRRAA
jgi:RimJ/RimL family protein N-acetyltransferase